MDLFMKGLVKVNRVFFAVSVFLLCGSTVIAIINAITRKFFPGLGGFTWAEELSAYLAALMLFIGVAYLELTDNHLSIGVIKSAMKEGPRKTSVLRIARVFRGILTLVILCIIIRYGFVVLINMVERGMVTYALRVTKAYFFVPMLIGFAMAVAVWAAMLIHSRGKETNYDG